MYKKSYLNIQKINRKTEDSQNQSFYKPPQAIKRIQICPIQSKNQKLNTKTFIPQNRLNKTQTLLSQNRLNATQTLTNKKKYNFNDAQASEKLKKYVKNFSKQYAQTQDYNGEKSQEINKRTKNWINSDRDEKLQKLQELYPSFPLKYLLYVWSQNVGVIPKIIQFLDQYSQIFNVPKIEVEIPIIETNKQEIVVQKQNISFEQQLWNHVPEKLHHKRKRYKIPQPQPRQIYNQYRIDIENAHKQKDKINYCQIKISNHKSMSNLDLKKQKIDRQIRELSSKSIRLLHHLILQSKQLYVNVHGYTREQCPELLSFMHQMIVSEYEKKNQIIKPEKRDKNDKHFYAKLTIQTGPGKHSQKYYKPVLKEQIRDLCRLRYHYEMFNSGIYIYFKLY